MVRPKSKPKSLQSTPCQNSSCRLLFCLAVPVCQCWYRRYSPFSWISLSLGGQRGAVGVERGEEGRVEEERWQAKRDERTNDEGKDTRA